MRHQSRRRNRHATLSSAIPNAGSVSERSASRAESCSQVMPERYTVGLVRSSGACRPHEQKALVSVIPFSRARAYSSPGTSADTGIDHPNSAPAPGSLSTHIRPLCASTIPFAMNKPRPVPSDCVSGACQ